VATRCQIVGGLRPGIVSNINQLLHNYNHYVQLFKVVNEKMFDQQNILTNIRVVITETMRPTGEHPRRYNSPLCDELGVLMPNENAKKNRYIVLHYKDGGCIAFQNCTGAMIHCNTH